MFLRECLQSALPRAWSGECLAEWGLQSSPRLCQGPLGCRPLLLPSWERAFLQPGICGEISFPICVLLIKRNTLG